MPTARELAAAAQARGAVAHLLDGSTAGDKPATLSAIAAALSFPDYFGHNLDALHDCLTDLAWLPPGEHVLIWSVPGVLRAADPAGYRAIVDTIRDAQRRTADSPRPLRLELADGG